MGREYQYTERYHGSYGEARLSPKMVNTQLGENLRAPHLPNPLVRATNAGRSALSDPDTGRRGRIGLPSRLSKD